MADMVRLYTHDAMEKVSTLARNVLGATCEGDELRVMMAGLRRLAKHEALNRSSRACSSVTNRSRCSLDLDDAVAHRAARAAGALQFAGQFLQRRRVERYPDHGHAGALAPSSRGRRAQRRRRACCSRRP
jgi:hypothetical protein